MPDRQASEAVPFWQLPLDALETNLVASAAGLDPPEAERRLARDGPNALAPPHQRALLLQFLSRFGNPLVLLLLGAAVISGFTGDRTSLYVIAAMILLSVSLDFVQEYRAGRAAERLKHSVALRATAVRGGQPVVVTTDRIVAGDVVRLGPGSLVPADGRVLEANHCFAQQALLTGESYPSEKRPGGPEPAGVEAGAAANSLFMGTSIISGTATMLVCRTGGATALGQISHLLVRRPPATAFELGVKSFGLFILKLAILLVLFVLLINAMFHRPWLESFLFAVALAVGLTPELLPMVVSITLARGAMRMAKERVIVKRLGAVHDLGSMDVLCTDKTGTLTEAKIRLERHEDLAGADSARVLELAYLNSALETGIVSPLDTAILGHTEVDITAWRKIAAAPFDFERRCVSVLADDGTRRVLILKGAFEDVLRRATRFEGEGAAGVQELDEAARARARQRFDALSGEGFRVLGIAWKELPSERTSISVEDEAGLVLAGLAAFEDPPKASAGDAVRALAKSGVTVKIVTGDNELVTRHLCAQIGLPVKEALLGSDLEGMSDTALAARAEQVDVFCRVTPPQKNRVIQALRSRRHVVGYMGDGINDAPSLYSADVGLSVEGAVDVAREAADLILLDADLGVVHRGVLEGRRTFGNILKYLMMATSSNFGNMFSMAAGTLVLPFLPLLPVQILLNNFLYDLSEVAIPLDRVDRESLARPRPWDLKFLRRFMLVIGPVSSLFDFLTFFIMLRVFHAGEALFHSGWFVESLATQTLVIFVIRTRGNPLRSHPAPLLVWSSLGVVACATLLPYTVLGARIGFVPLPAPYFAFLAGMVIAYLALVEAVKRWFYRRLAPAAATRGA
jgi:Mg2+-importing ATPase